MKKRIELSAVVLALFGAAMFAPAAVLYTDASAAVGGADSASVTTYIASSFVTGSATTTLSASLLLQQIASGADTVSVYSSSTYTPDTFVGKLTAGATPSSTAAGLITFSSSSLSLSAGTTYWLVLSSAGSVAWSYSSDSTLTNGWAVTDDSGTTWGSIGDSYPYVFSVSDTIVVVPEPAALTTLGVSGVVLLRRRRA